MLFDTIAYRQGILENWPAILRCTRYGRDDGREES